MTREDDWGHAAAAKPAPGRTIGEALAALPDARRRDRAAIMLATSGRACTVPALEVEGPAGPGGMWSVTCAEGGYTLILSPDGTRVITGGAK